MESLETKIDGVEFVRLFNSNKRGIRGYTITTDINIEDYSNSEYFLEIEHCTFQGNVFFKGSRLEHSIQFDNCKFLKDFHFENSVCSSISIKNSECDQILWVDNSEFLTLGIENISAKGSVRLKSIKASFLSISDLENQSITVYNPNIKRLMIHGLKNESEVYITDKEYKATYESNPIIEELNFFCSLESTSRFYLKNIMISLFELSGTNLKGKIFIKDVGCKNITVTNFINYGMVSVNNIYAADNYSSLIIQDSNIGNAEVYKTMFAGFKIIEVRDSIIENIITSNIKWCDKVENGNVITRPEDLREIYRQLKNVMVRTRNKPEELKFYSYEMDAYYEELSKSSGRIDEKFIIYTNRLTNKHGLSWSRTLKILILLNLIFYTTIKYFIAERNFGTQYIIGDIVNFIEFINPIHKVENVFMSQITVESKLIDVISRLLNGYLIFQFLSAFRRFVRN